MHQPSADLPLLDRVQRALKSPDRAWTATRLSGKAIHVGVDHKYSYDFLSDGRFVQSFSGPNPETFGNDGKNYWEDDGSHAVQKLDLEDRDRQMAINLVLSDNWLLSSPPVRLTADGDTVHMLLKETGQEVEIRVDPTTALPVEASFHGAEGTTSIKLSDWKNAGDRKLPMRAEVTTDGSTETYECDQVTAIKREDARTAMPAWGVTDTTFDDTKLPTLESRFAGKRHILVHPLVNGQDIGWFIVDSGSGPMIIDKAKADSMHLQTIGHDTGTGVGGSVESSTRVVSEFSLGPVTMRNQRFGDFDLAQITKGGAVPIAGIVGSAFMRRVVMTINWNGPVVKVFDRTKFKLDRGNWERLRFSGGNPAVYAGISGAPKSWYRLDSGAAGFLTLHSPFVKKWNFLEGKDTTASSSTGAGGTVTARTGKVKWFEFSGRRFENPTIQFSTATVGTFSDPYLAGNIGIDAISKFEVVLDFTGSRVAFLN